MYEEFKDNRQKLSLQIAHICRTLEYQVFLSSTRRMILKAELDHLIQKRNEYDKVIPLEK